MSNRIVVVGAGFAALSAARRLRRLDRKVDIVLVAPRPELIFLPSLIWIPAGLRTRADLTVPLERFFGRERVEFHAAQATGLADRGRTLLTTAGPISNDGLILATGGSFLKKLPGIEHAVTPCEGIAAAEKIRDRIAGLDEGVVALGIAGNPLEPTAMRGGPMFEFLFGLDTLLRRQRRREKVKLVFFAPMEKPGQRLGERAVQRLLAQMDRRGIEKRLGRKLLGFEADRVRTEGGEFRADLIVFMPGMTGNAWFDNTGLPRSPGGLVKADAHCRVESHERVYVAGDAGSFPGPDWMPKQAHMADLQGETAAENLLSELRGSAPERTFKVELVCVVDSLDGGMLVRRTAGSALALPPLRLMHGAKSLFERWYLRRYR